MDPFRLPLSILLLVLAGGAPGVAAPPRLTCRWERNMLTIAGEHLPGKELQIHYLEAYCRPGSTSRDWHETVIGHTTELVAQSDDRTSLELQCTLRDGVTVKHLVTCRGDEVIFQLVAHNPTATASLAHWAQPCVRVGEFTGTGESSTDDKYAYLGHSFIVLNGRLATMPTADWATEARYTPGQVWCPAHVPRTDVNPRPLSTVIPDNGLIGCFSADRRMILAMAWEPYQELFQGVIRCLHSDFRIGGLAPGETRKIRGKIYFVKNDVPALLRRYGKDFPEQGRPKR